MVSETTCEFVLVAEDKVPNLGTIQIEFPFEVICSVPKKPYGGTIRVEIEPQSNADGMVPLLEWNSFAAWIKSLRGEMFLAEEVASMVVEKIWNLVNPEWVSAKVTVSSAFHLPVVIRAFKGEEGVLHVHNS